ncbi:MAG: AMP-binding protein, partial [Gammaproteobacteria bacterium]|nr:AMP-binding protein [Gammaproteobacteria bacterium]
MSENLYHWLFRRASRQPQRVFLDCPGRSALSYGDMDGLVARYAAVLRELGVTPDDRVLVQVEKSLEAVVLYLACLRLGAIYVPLNVAYTASETAFFLDDCEPRLAILSVERRAELQVTGGSARIPRALPLTGPDDSLANRAAGCQPDTRVVARETTDLAAIIYTSGTTGRAKGAMLSVGNLSSNAQALYQAWGWQDDDVLIHALPIFHVHGLFVALHCAILGGSRVLFLPRFDVAEILAALPRGTVMMGVPTFYTRLLAEPGFTRGVCEHARLFVSGSAPLSPRTFSEFEERTGHRILERYGMSEAGIITSNPLEGPRVAGTVGFALPEVELRIAQAEGRAAADDAVGELEIRGPNVFRGYW